METSLVMFLKFISVTNQKIKQLWDKACLPSPFLWAAFSLPFPCSWVLTEKGQKSQDGDCK